MRTDDPWQIISSEIKYQNRWMRIIEDKVITPTGSDGIYAYLDSKDSVVIAVLNDENKLYVQRAFAYPTHSWHWELPGGNSDGEDGEMASKRELEEETGITANTWEKLGQTFVCNGFMTESMAIYLARNPTLNGQRESSDELINEGHFVSMDDIDTMIQNGDINDSQSITAIYLAQKWLEQHKS